MYKHFQDKNGEMALAFGSEDIIKAARNMHFLTKASLTECVLTQHFIANISASPRLADLTLRVEPDPSRWTEKNTAVRSLTWHVPVDWLSDPAKDSWNAAALVLDIAKTIFPEVVELDIMTIERNGHDDAGRAFPQAATENKQGVLLPRLQSFRYRGGVDAGEDGLILNFIRKDGVTLTSLTVSFGFALNEVWAMDYLQQIIEGAPRLKSLVIPRSQWEQEWPLHRQPVWSHQLSAASLADGFEFFDVWNIGCSLSPEIGQWLARWTSLKILKTGCSIHEYEEDTYDGSYFQPIFVPEVAIFVACLPQSIEELYIDIASEQLACEGDPSTVEPLTNKVFRSLKRLHTFDIGGWESEGGWMYEPEYALFCCRRPSDHSPDDNTRKCVWISTLRGEYDGDRVKVHNSVEELQGNFKGKDAEDP